MNYYNEHDPRAAAWLRELINAGEIPEGLVDERSIVDVQPDDLAGYIQCHFFAGIGGWPLALKLAGWPAERHVWTGSCPCQPFSTAGKGLGEKDERHLWPEFLRLIAQRNPAIVFGEQVASAAGRLWLNGVQVDLEALAFEVGASDLCAAGVGSPQIRQRLFWIGVSRSAGQQVSRSAPRFAGWPTCSSRDWKDSPGMSMMGINPDGTIRIRLDQLPRVAALAGWTTPSATDGNRSGKGVTKNMSGSSLSQQANMAGWRSPIAGDSKMRASNQQMAKKRMLSGKQLGNEILAHGIITTSSTALTEKRGALNPAHSRWLMGYPVAWDSCGAMAMASFRSSAQSSSLRAKKRSKKA